MIWQPLPELWALDLQPLDGNLPKSVLNTIYQAKTPSTRWFFAPKWSVFTAW